LNDYKLKKPFFLQKFQLSLSGRIRLEAPPRADAEKTGNLSVLIGIAVNLFDLYYVCIPPFDLFRTAAAPAAFLQKIKSSV
jgi:hypothetical protein